MLLAYDLDGAVVFQIGMNSLWPQGPPDELLPDQFASAGVQPTGWVRLDDAADEELVEQVLRRGARVINGRVELLPEPPPMQVEPAPTPDGAIAYGEVKTVDPLTVTIDDVNTPAGRLAGYTPEAKHMVKLTRIFGQWVVEDRVLLNT